MSPLFHQRSKETLKYHVKKGRTSVVINAKCDYTETTERSSMDRKFLYRPQAVKLIPPVYFHDFQNYYFNRKYGGGSHMLNSASEKQFGLVHIHQARVKRKYNTWHNGRNSSATVHEASFRGQGIEAEAAGLILVVSTKNTIETSELIRGCAPRTFLLWMNSNVSKGVINNAGIAGS